jgi:hypothetical protein
VFGQASSQIAFLNRFGFLPLVAADDLFRAIGIVGYDVHNNHMTVDSLYTDPRIGEDVHMLLWRYLL